MNVETGNRGLNDLNRVPLKGSLKGDYKGSIRVLRIV